MLSEVSPPSPAPRRQRVESSRSRRCWGLLGAGPAKSPSRSSRWLHRMSRLSGNSAPRRASIAFLACLTGLGATACSSSKSSAGQLSSLHGSTILVGQLTSITGAVGNSTTLVAKQTLDAWVSYVNASGGINGHPVKLITIDDHSSPALASVGANRLVADHVVAVVGLFAVQTTSVWEPIFAKAHIPVIGGAPYFPSWTTDPNMFPANTTFPGEILDLILTARSRAATNFGVIYDTANPSGAQAIPLLRSIAPTLGVKFTTAVGASNSAPDFTAQCLSLHQAGTTAVMNDGINNIQKVADECSQQGFKPTWVLPEGGINYPPAYTDPALQGAVSAQGEFPWFLTSTPATRQFHDALRRYSPSVLTSQQPLVAAPSAYIWTAAMVFQKAATDGISATDTSPSAADIFNGLYQITGDTLGGLAPVPLTYNRDKPTGSINCWFVTSLQNGQPTAPFGMRPQCVPGAPPIGHVPGF